MAIPAADLKKLKQLSESARRGRAAGRRGDHAGIRTVRRPIGAPGRGSGEGPCSPHGGEPHGDTDRRRRPHRRATRRHRHPSAHSAACVYLRFERPPCCRGWWWPTWPKPAKRARQATRQQQDAKASQKVLKPWPPRAWTSWKPIWHPAPYAGKSCARPSPRCLSRSRATAICRPGHGTGASRTRCRRVGIRKHRVQPNPCGGRQSPERPRHREPGTGRRPKPRSMTPNVHQRVAAARRSLSVHWPKRPRPCSVSRPPQPSSRA